jgi:hypothetical protein
MTPNALYGAWEYQAWEIRYEDGRISSPFGASASGLLIYSSDGYMTATIMAGGRQLLSQANPRLATHEEKAAAFDSYFTYAGRWRVQDDRVVHEVTLALNANLIGTPQWRDAQLQGDALVLSAKEQMSKGERLHSLVWRRGRADR